MKKIFFVMNLLCCVPTALHCMRFAQPDNSKALVEQKNKSVIPQLLKPYCTFLSKKIEAIPAADFSSHASYLDDNVLIYVDKMNKVIIKAKDSCSGTADLYINKNGVCTERLTGSVVSHDASIVLLDTARSVKLFKKSAEESAYKQYAKFADRLNSYCFDTNNNIYGIGDDGDGETIVLRTIITSDDQHTVIKDKEIGKFFGVKEILYDNARDQLIYRTNSCVYVRPINQQVKWRCIAEYDDSMISKVLIGFSSGKLVIRRSSGPKKDRYSVIDLADNFTSRDIDNIYVGPKTLETISPDGNFLIIGDRDNHQYTYVHIQSSEHFSIPAVGWITELGRCRSVEELSDGSTVIVPLLDDTVLKAVMHVTDPNDPLFDQRQKIQMIRDLSNLFSGIKVDTTSLPVEVKMLLAENPDLHLIRKDLLSGIVKVRKEDKKNNTKIEDSNSNSNLPGFMQKMVAWWNVAKLHQKGGCAVAVSLALAAVIYQLVKIAKVGYVQ